MSLPELLTAKMVLHANGAPGHQCVTLLRVLGSAAPHGSGVAERVVG
jgi:hypothetical protein